jgi:hypothetical protein
LDTSNNFESSSGRESFAGDKTLVSLLLLGLTLLAASFAGYIDRTCGKRLEHVVSTCLLLLTMRRFVGEEFTPLPPEIPVSLSNILSVSCKLRQTSRSRTCFNKLSPTQVRNHDIVITRYEAMISTYDYCHLPIILVLKHLSFRLVMI